MNSMWTLRYMYLLKKVRLLSWRFFSSLNPIQLNSVLDCNCEVVFRANAHQHHTWSSRRKRVCQKGQKMLAYPIYVDNVH